MRSSKTNGEEQAGESPKRKTRGAALSVSAKKPAAGAASPRTPRKKTTAAAEDAQLPEQGAIDRMVAEAAYYLAEKRAFAPGFEEQDWQAAKAQIAGQLRNARNPLG
jgi:hypothetical protein